MLSSSPQTLLFGGPIAEELGSLPRAHFVWSPDAIVETSFGEAVNVSVVLSD